MEDAAYSYLEGVYISTNLDAWCHYFHILNYYHSKGHHTDNTRMMYKAENDGKQSDYLCHKGSKYQLFMFTDTVPKTY